MFNINEGMNFISCLLSHDNTISQSIYKYHIAALPLQNYCVVSINSTFLSPTRFWYLRLLTQTDFFNMYFVHFRYANFNYNTTIMK